MTTTRQADIVIIGTGTAGMSAYREAARFTDNMLLLEAGRYGTTCARVGCMPSKLLIAPAEARHRAEHFSAFGLRGDKPDVDGEAVLARMRAERDRFVGFVEDAVESFPQRHRLMARARFRDDQTLELDSGDLIKAGRIIIATGSRPHIPEMFHAAGDRLITSDDVFDWQDFPKSVAVFGAGVIGLELGQALHRLGVRIRLFGRSGSIGPLSDPDVRAYAEQCFTGEYPLHSKAEIHEIGREGEQVMIRFTGEDGQEQTEYVDYLLCATGRRGNIDQLGLEHTSLKCDERGTPLFNPQTMQCGDSSIFIAGDAKNQLQLLHEAADEGRLAGENAGRYPDILPRARRTPLSVVFTDPQIAIAGMRYRELREQGIDFATGSVDFTDQGRARVMLASPGLLRLYAEKERGCLLGAEMIGPHHEHFAHLLAWAIQQRLSAAELVQMPFYHPVLEEGLRTAIRDLLGNLGMDKKPPLRCIDRHQAGV